MPTATAILPEHVSEQLKLKAERFKPLITELEGRRFVAQEVAAALGDLSSIVAYAQSNDRSRAEVYYALCSMRQSGIESARDKIPHSDSLRMTTQHFINAYSNAIHASKRCDATHAAEFAESARCLANTVNDLLGKS